MQRTLFQTQRVRAALVAVALTALAAPAAAQPAGALNVEQWIRERVEGGQNAGIVVGVIDSAGVRTYAYGTDGRGGTVDAQTLFEIGSVSKVLTATALAALATAGTVGLDAPIDGFLPEPAPRHGDRAITLRDLATHRSGLPRLPTNLNLLDPAVQTDPYAAYGADELLAFLATYPLAVEPGTQQLYSNVGAGLLGYLLGEAVGTSYGEVVRRHVLAPLGLEDTYLEVPEAAEPRFAQGHHGGASPRLHWHFDALAGAGAYRSSLADMLAFVQANLDPEATAIAEALRLAQTPQPGAGDVAGAQGVGLGWQIRIVDGEAFHWHNGGTGGFRSFVGFSRTRGTGVVVLTNSDTAVDDLGWQILRDR